MNQVSHRRRFALGLLLGLGVGVALLALILQQWHSGLRLMQASRSGIVLAQSLVEVVHEALAAGVEVQPIISGVAKQNKMLKTVRVVHGVRLEASTAPQDTGELAAPRRLAREEKSVYDQGQRLRAAVLTNREEGVSRKDEIEITELPSGGLSLAAPIEQDGGVVGFVQVETQSAPAPLPVGWLTPAAVVFVPVIVFLLLGMVLGEKRALLAAVAFVLLAAGLGWYAFHVRKSVESERRALDASLATMANEQVARTQASLQSLGVQMSSPPKPSSWDVDVYRRPRALITDQGSVNEQKLTEEVGKQVGALNQAIAGIGFLAILLTAVFGFGGASKLWSTLTRYREAYAYTTPAMVGMLVLVFFPFFYGIILSFTEASLYNSDKSIPEIWIGIKNYVDVLGDFSLFQKGDTGLVINYQNFYWTLFFNIVWTVTNVAFGVSFGLLMALILNTKGLAIRPIYRVLLILPWATPNYITALIWRGMFHQQFGVVNQMLQIFGIEPVSWFEKFSTSFFTAWATNAWLSFPFMMVVSLGALQSIPSDLYEAARVDGATRWQQFKSITLPSLRPALVPAIILSVVWTFNMFNIIFLVTAGEPGGSTEILITQAYKIAFQKYRYGYAAAYSTVIFIILLAYGTFQNRVTRATESIAG